MIVALGGNALIRSGQTGTVKEQLENVRIPLRQIAELSKKYNIIVTHGNGPQVGDLLLQQESTLEVSKMPLGILVAGTQGRIGFMIESTLDEELMRLGISDEKLFLTVLTYVKVSPDDPAFQNPTKPIGPAYKKKQPGFVKTPKGWRKVVPSPKPIKIYQWREIKRLIQQNFIVIACGGGGVPVIKEENRLVATEAVIDKDLASVTLGQQIAADSVIIATDEEKLAIHFGTPKEKRLDSLTVSQAKRYLKAGHFPDGSMGPKVQAAINHMEFGGEEAIICHIDRIKDALNGKTGTRITL